MRLVLRNAQVFDTASLDFVGERCLTIEDGRITAVEGAHAPPADREIDARGAYALPGFIDAHVHFRLATLDFRKLADWTEVEFGIAMAKLSRDTLARGFTSVRDTGGELRGLLRAIATGAVPGPRTVRSGLMISQTGGHGDADGGERRVPDCACQMQHTAFGIVADGPDAVRKAARHLLRDGADFLKIYVSGGVASPSDPLDCVQYTPAEVSAATEEARNRRTYVAAHAYLPDAIEMAVRNGVRSIEHANLIGETQVRQNDEFAIRAECLDARDILRSMYQVNPRLLRMEGEIGVLAPGAHGDVVLCHRNPLDDIGALSAPEKALSHVIRAGEVAWSRAD